MAEDINNLTEDELWNMSDEELEAQVAVEPRDDTDIEVIEDNNDLEQPVDQDSDDNASDEEEFEEESEEPSEDTDVDVDDTADVDGTEVEEEQVTEDKSDNTDEAQPTQSKKLKVKANGREFEFTTEEVLEKFPQVFGQAMDYTRKTQAIKPWRKQIDALEQNDIKPEDLNLMIDVLKGNKDAIAEVIKRTGVDTLELPLEEEHNYEPQDYGRDEVQLDLQEVLTEISRDPEYDRTANVLSREWDEQSFNELTSNPAMVKGLHADVKSGLYDKLMPTVEKLKLYDRSRKPYIEYYKQAADDYFSQVEQEKVQQTIQAQAAKISEVKAKQQTVKTEAAKSSRRKAAAPVNKSTGGKKAVDYLDDSDEAFEEWYAKVQESM